jgi:hypothetical protein
MGAFAFYGCLGLQEIHSKNPIAPLLSNLDCFDYPTRTNCKLYVPTGTSAVYQTWGFSNIIEEETANDVINKDNLILKTISNGLSIETQETTPIAVFTISGQTVYQSNINGHAEISLDKGIYIVRIKNESQKIVVR